MIFQVSLRYDMITKTRGRVIYFMWIEFDFITIMNIYDQAWKSIVKPTQVITKKHLLGPEERFISDCKISRVDL